MGFNESKFCAKFVSKEKLVFGAYFLLVKLCRNSKKSELYFTSIVIITYKKRSISLAQIKALQSELS